jgi:hypothetical protein
MREQRPHILYSKRSKSRREHVRSGPGGSGNGDELVSCLGLDPNLAHFERRREAKTQLLTHPKQKNTRTQLLECETWRIEPW